MSNDAQEYDRRFRHSDFGIPSGFVIRHSDLGIALREKPLSLFRMHWDPEPRTKGTAPPRCCRHLAGSAFLRLVCRQDAGSALWFLKRDPPHYFAEASKVLMHCRTGRLSRITLEHGPKRRAGRPARVRHWRSARP